MGSAPWAVAGEGWPTLPSDTAHGPTAIHACAVPSLEATSSLSSSLCSAASLEPSQGSSQQLPAMTPMATAPIGSPPGNHLHPPGPEPLPLCRS